MASADETLLPLDARLAPARIDALPRHHLAGKDTSHWRVVFSRLALTTRPKCLADTRAF